MNCMCDGGGNNILKRGFYCSYAIEEQIYSRIPLDVRSTNEAEYMALILLLENLCLTGVRESVIIRSDSKLVVEQVNGNWRIEKQTLMPFYLKAIGLISSIQTNYGITVTLEWTSRKNVIPILGH